MATCCGGRGSPRPRGKLPKPDRGRQVLAGYVGDREGLFSLRGAATGQKYYFAANGADRLQVVWSGDLENGMERMCVVYAGELADAESENAGDTSSSGEL